MNKNDFSQKENEFYGNFVDPEGHIVPSEVLEAGMVVLLAGGFVACAALAASVNFVLRLVRKSR